MNDLKFTTAGDFLKSQQQRIGFACKYMDPVQTQQKELFELKQLDDIEGTLDPTTFMTSKTPTE